MLAGEAQVVRGMPVLGEHADVEFGNERADWHDNLVAAGDGKRTAGTKVLLDVDHQDRLVALSHGSLHFGPVALRHWASRSNPACLCCQ